MEFDRVREFGCRSMQRQQMHVYTALRQAIGPSHGMYAIGCAKKRNTPGGVGGRQNSFYRLLVHQECTRPALMKNATKSISD